MKKLIIEPVSKEKVTGVITAILTFAVIFLLRVWLHDLSIKTNSPLVIMIDILNYGTFTSLIQFLLVFALFNLKSWDIELKSVIRNRFFIISVAVTIAISLLFCLLPMSNRFGNIKVDDKRPSKLKYCCYLLVDAVNKNTDSVSMNSEALFIESHSYTVRSGRGGRSKHYTVHYASFEGYSTLLYKTSAEKYIRTCRNIGKEIEVEYYEKSGIIKTVDGIGLYDKNGFDKAVYDIEQAEAEKQAAEEALRKKEEEKSLALFSAFFESEGKDYNAIMDQLRKDNIEYTYSTEYISTKYFEPGEVAFFDNQNHIVYVVRDNDAEEMKVVPSLPHNGTLPEITKILDENGIKWTFDCFGSVGMHEENLDHSHDTLKTVHSSPGTPIPEDFVFWFSVDHVDE